MYTRILATIRNSTEHNTRKMYCVWTGELDWPCVHSGELFSHCPGWVGETIDRVWHNFSNDSNDRPRIEIEIFTTTEVVQHLADEHGFNLYQ